MLDRTNALMSTLVACIEDGIDSLLEQAFVHRFYYLKLVPSRAFFLYLIIQWFLVEFWMCARVAQ